MNTLPVYESLYKWRDDAGEVRIERLKNRALRQHVFQLQRVIPVVALPPRNPDILGKAGKLVDYQERYG